VAISEFYTLKSILCSDTKVTTVYKMMELSGKFYYVVSKVNGFFQTICIHRVMVTESFAAVTNSIF